MAGLGGFAAEHHAALAAMEATGECRVVATCDPDVVRHGDRFRLDERGVAVYPSLEALLQAHTDLDLLALPTPLPLHAAHHAMAVDAGVACYLEKPPSLWWPEYQAMRAIERRAAKATQVGFNFVGDPLRRALKKRLLAGEFGALKEARLHAVWPRDAAYYGRNGWAGRLRVGEGWVIDSCIGNALAHYLQNLLFWGGEGSVDAVGRLDGVRAWLGRTHPIESYDTAFVEATLLDGAVLRIGATHAEIGAGFERETLVLENARIVFDRWNEARIEWADGTVERRASAIPDQAALLRHNLAETLAYIQGRRSRPMTRLEDSEAFVALCDLALVSSGAIHDVPEPSTLVESLDRFVEQGRWPFETPDRAAMDDLSRLPEVAAHVASAWNPWDHA